MSDQGEFIIATADGSANGGSDSDGSVLLYGVNFSSDANKPWVSYGPLQMLLPMKQHDPIYIRGNGSDAVSVVFTAEVNRQA